MTKQMRLSGRVSRHLAKSVLLEESGSPLMTRWALIFGSAVTLSFLIWAANMEVAEVAVAPGRILPGGKVQEVQHPDGGLVSEILGREGERVAAGQVVLKLDPVASRSHLTQSESDLGLLLAKQERLTAVIEGRTPDFSKVFGASPGARRDQEVLFKQQLKAHEAGRLILENQILQLRAELAELGERQKSLTEQERLLQEEMQMRKKLFDRGLNSKTLYLALQRKQSEMQGERAQLPPQRAKTRHRIKEIQRQLEEADARFVEEALAERAEVNHELSQVQETLRRRNQEVDLLLVRAPMAGIIHGLNAHTLGGVVKPGETIFKIVPKERSLIAEVRIAARDIGHVQVGQPVTLKFTTYDFARYGGLQGRLEQISATTFFEEAGDPYYRGSVSLARAHIGGDPRSNPILPGMSLDADIRTGGKTVMTYLLKPVFASARQALRER